MSDRDERSARRGPRARATKIAALAGALTLGAALLVWTLVPRPQAPPAHEPASRDLAAQDRGTPPRSGPPAIPANRAAAAAGQDALTVSQQARTVVDPEEALLHGPTDPITPPEIRIDVDIAPRGAMTSEPLVPPVVNADADLPPGAGRTPRGAAPDEPLTPPVVYADPR